jgi:hypothetical protein
MKRPVTSSIPDQPASTPIKPVQQVVKTDATDAENPEKTLVVETPAGERDETIRVDTHQTNIARAYSNQIASSWGPLTLKNARAT